MPHAMRRDVEMLLLLLYVLLFEHYSPMVTMRSSNTLPDNGAGVKRQLNYEIMMHKGYQPSYRTCFGEIKGKGAQHTPSIMDFYRLGVFAKLVFG
ncbi:hypothetical protein BCV72DRAFT_234439 [Rhizopus microsporus var. microsporus]|uniref:Secreted protein n=1 Tax=Rhizopus microsporus var. microsporus TaxID=86635 RepID=A0A1X0QSA9_RHIZD|nr:hypothetical protein BCV72DRAFT_234439 [Rhizopus microsporus var. microsporus]